jgi:hypothetical protein
MIDAEQGSWNFAVNPCFVMKLREGKAKGKAVEDVEAEMKRTCKQSLLEQAIAP